MKIITSNKAYVQYSDISFLLKNLCEIKVPGSVINACFSDKPFVCTDKNRDEFIEFDKPEQIEFFKWLDCCVDYLEIVDLSYDKIAELGMLIVDERCLLAKEMCSGNGVNKEMTTRYQFLNFKMDSLIDILAFKQGRKKY